MLVTLRGLAFSTNGELPMVGQLAPDFKLRAKDQSDKSLHDFKGQFIVLNIFPSIDTSTCATSVRQFNQKASELPNTKILCISRDLTYAQKRFCGAEGLDNVINLSDFVNGDFGKTYGVYLLDGPLRDLLARAVVVINPQGIVTYTELVHEISEEPDYHAVISVIAN